MRVFKFLAMLGILGFTLFGVNFGDFVPVKAESSQTGIYEEYLDLIVVPQIGGGNVTARFTFVNVTGPLDVSDFTSERSTVQAVIIGSDSSTGQQQSTSLVVVLNASIADTSEGRIWADKIKAKFEGLFRMTLPFLRNETAFGMRSYIYSINWCPIGRFREVFFNCKPSDGFAKLVTPDLLENDFSISFWLVKIQGNLVWEISASAIYSYAEGVTLDREYTFSLRGITGYSEAIQVSPRSTRSLMRIYVDQYDAKFKLTSFETVPSQMTSRQSPGSTVGITTFAFEKTVTGSVEDLSIHFRVVSPDSTGQLVIIVATVIGIVVVLGIVIFVSRKRHKL